MIKVSKYFYVFLICALSSCKKDVSDLTPVAVFDTGQAQRINELVFLQNDVWIACGGQRNESGVILRSEDRGKNWMRYDVEFLSSVYCVDFIDSLNGFAGGDFLRLWRTDNGGKSWSFYWLGDQVPFNEEDRPGIRNMVLRNDSSWYFCGGEHLGEGVIYKTSNAGHQWNYEFRQHEYRSLDFFPDGTAIIGGHGSVLTMEDDLKDLQDTGFDKDFITGLVTIDNQSVVAASYNGALYSSDAKGLSMKEIDTSNRPFGKRVNWNDIDENEGVIAVVGNEGMYSESTDQGQTWSYSIVDQEPDMLCVVIESGKIFVTTANGKILQLK